MRKYLYEAKTADGEPKSGYAEASTVGEARAKLLAQGLTDLIVLDDDNSAALRESCEDDGNLVDSDIDLLSRYKSSPWRLAALGVRKNWVSNLAFAGLVFWLASSGLTLGAAAIAVIAVAVALFPGWVVWQQNEVYRQFWLGNWDASERVARRVRSLWFLKTVWPAQLELDSRIASALVKKGDVVGAAMTMAPWKGSDKVPASAVESKVAGLAFLARDWPGFLASLERGLVLSQHADNGKIDVAQGLARVGNDDARATALLDEVDTEAMGPLPLAFYRWGRGVIALNRGENEAAVEHLAVAVAETQKMGENPLMWGVLASTAGYLALAMARTGRREAAVGMLAHVKSIVQWHAEDRLVDGLRSQGLL